MHDLAVEVGTPVAVDDAEEEEARQQEEIRHAEGTREGDDLVHEAFPAHGVADAKRGMHHDDERDADALGVVEPNDAVLGRRGGSERRGGAARKRARNSRHASGRDTGWGCVAVWDRDEVSADIWRVSRG